MKQNNTPITDKIIDTKSCSHCNENFTITQSDRDFYDKISPKFADYTATIPSPTLCPKCRQRRRLAFRNERKLYRRICDATQQPIISLYSPDKEYTIYNQQTWRGDSWDPLIHGIDFNNNLSISQHIQTLWQKIPYSSIINDNWITSENCEYTNDFLAGKNCYMCFEMWETEDCSFCHHCNGSKSCYDCDESSSCSFCYETHDSQNSSYCQWSIGLDNCQKCFHSKYLQWCQSCTFCIDLQNQSYHYLNQPLSKEAYSQIIHKLQNDTIFFQQEYQKFEQLIQNKPQNNLIINSPWSTGRNIKNSSNLTNCRNSFQSQDCKNCLSLYEVKDCMDIQCRKSQYCLEWQTSDESYLSHFCTWLTNCTNTFYSSHCHNSQDIFGCVWLRNKSYCIFNKQYTKEEYNKIVPQIIEKMKADGEWGEFFHPSLSPFGYNETVAMEYHPLTKNEAIKLGYNWSNYESPAPQSDKVIPGEKLPSQWCDIINQQKPEFLQDIVRYAIQCEVSKQLFKLQPTEIQFYIKHNIPLPRKHPDVRHMERMQLRK